MSTPPVSAPRRRRVWLIAGVVLGLCFMGLASLIYDACTLTREARILKTALLGRMSVPVSTRIELSTGPAMLAAVRQVVRCIDDVPPEARQALKAVRSASVGVFQLKGDFPERGERVKAANAAMAARGWKRLVGVTEATSTVLVYGEAARAHAQEVRLCVAVLQPDQIVLVSTEVEPESLFPLVATHLAERAVEL